MVIVKSPKAAKAKPWQNVQRHTRDTQCQFPEWNSLETQRFTHFKKASASTKHEYNQAPLKRASNLFHLTKTRPELHCVLRVEGHWSMPRTGNSSEFNTLSAQFIYCCVSNGPGYCESTWKRGTKAPPYATQNSGHKEGASLLNRS